MIKLKNMIKENMQINELWKELTTSVLLLIAPILGTSTTQIKAADDNAKKVATIEKDINAPDWIEDDGKVTTSFGTFNMWAVGRAISDNIVTARTIAELNAKTKLVAMILESGENLKYTEESALDWSEIEDKKILRTHDGKFIVYVLMHTHRLTTNRDSWRKYPK